LQLHGGAKPPAGLNHDCGVLGPPELLDIRRLSTGVVEQASSRQAIRAIKFIERRFADQALSLREGRHKTGPDYCTRNTNCLKNCNLHECERAVSKALRP
jgi:hypothetical protein